jgi:hypothetical protein
VEPVRSFRTIAKAARGSSFPPPFFLSANLSDSRSRDLRLGFRRIMGYEDIWMLKAVLDEWSADEPLAR